MAVATSLILGADGRPLVPARRGYDGAARSRRTSNWRTSSTGPNLEIAGALVTLRDRHRDLARNNPWARRAIQSIVTNWVGAGLRAQWSSARRQARWSAWWESTACDADGRLDGYGLQALITRAVVESGEVLVRRRPRRAEAGPIPLHIQILECDFLDSSRRAELADGYIDQGIQFDALGRRVGYWLFNSHPGESYRAGRTSSFHAASDILHIFRGDRPGQVRGVPWGTGSINRLRMLDDYQDAQLERQRLAACYMGFRRIPDPSLIDGQDSRDDYVLLDKLEPGAVEDLPPGWDIEFASPPQPEDDESFTKGILRAVASDYGIPYDTLTGDLSEVNFSSARMGFQEFSRNIESWRWQLLAPQFLVPLVDWYLDAEAIGGFNGRPEQPLWTAPSRQVVDPAREIPALRDAVRAGFMSLPQAIRAQGFDPLVLATEHAAYLAELDKLGIAFDSDGRHPPTGPAAVAATPPNDQEDPAP